MISVNDQNHLKSPIPSELQNCVLLEAPSEQGSSARRLPTGTIARIDPIQNGASADAVPIRASVLSLASALYIGAIPISFAGAEEMKFAGLSLLLAGWLLVLAAIVLLSAATPRAAFALAGCSVESLGLVLTVRAHFGGHRENE